MGDAMGNDIEDIEFHAMHTVFGLLSPLDEAARLRVVTYVTTRLGISTVNQPASSPQGGDDEGSAVVETGAATRFSSFAELFDAAQPEGGAMYALVAAYWCQVCTGAESFDAQSANRELKHLGHGLSNITSAIDSLKSQKPALVLQLKKSGSSQQARKIYKVTVSGMKVVESMIAS